MFKKRLILFLKGILMGICDLIPGISGGTIAFITGIYEELIDTIRSFEPGLISIIKRGGFPAFWKKYGRSRAG